jgi:hypothetical protein
MRICDLCGNQTRSYSICQSCADEINKGLTAEILKTERLIADSREREAWDSPTNHRISPDPEYVWGELA